MSADRLWSSLAVLIACCIVSCAAPATSTTQQSPSPTIAAPPRSSPTVTQTTAPTTIGARTFASVCGNITDFVSDSARTSGSFVLMSPGRDPLKIVIPAGRLGGVAASYVCVEVQAGVPSPLFAGFFPGRTPGFVEPGAVPATTAFPAPTGFTPPQTCAYIAAPVVGADQIDWAIDCGAANNDARGILGAALTQQGWSSCGSGLATAQWRKTGVMLVVAESSLASGSYPRLTQYARVTSPCA